jgi:hypothetical protein
MIVMLSSGAIETIETIEIIVMVTTVPENVTAATGMGTPTMGDRSSFARLH